MTVARHNQMGSLGETTSALYLTAPWARQGQRISQFEANVQGAALDWSQQRSREGRPLLYGVIGFARDPLDRQARKRARDADHIRNDVSQRVANLMRSRGSRPISRVFRCSWHPSAQRRAGAAFTPLIPFNVTPELRGRIKVAAFRRGVTVAQMRRDLLAREFPPQSGDQP